MQREGWRRCPFRLKAVEDALRSDTAAGDLIAALLPIDRYGNDAARAACLFVGKALSTVIKAGTKYLKEG